MSGDMQISYTAASTAMEKPPRPSSWISSSSSSSSSNSLVKTLQYTATPTPNTDDLEAKLQHIMDCVPDRVSNTSSSSAGAGSGEFHLFCQRRRKEQDRVSRMDFEYLKEKELEAFNMRREERLSAEEEKTAKKRMKRQKYKERKKEKGIEWKQQKQEKRNELMSAAAAIET